MGDVVGAVGDVASPVLGAVGGLTGREDLVGGVVSGAGEAVGDVVNAVDDATAPVLGAVGL